MSWNWVFVAVGGAAGSLARYGVGSAAQELAKQLNFPIGTFAVNLVGCLLIGVFFGRYERMEMPDYTRLLLVVGFLGGFTTFSSFGYETFELIRGGEIWLALGNVLLQCTAGLLLVWLGTVLARLF